MLASSQGRKCSEMLGRKLVENYEVCGVLKPNAKMQEVVEHVDKLSADFGSDRRKR